MRKSIFIGVLALMGVSLASCLGDGDTPDNGKKWKERNDQWLMEREAELDSEGKPVYTKIGCDWDVSGYVLVKWHNDRSLTTKNLSPLYTSTIDVKYQLTNIDSVMIDNSYSRTTPADSIYRTKLSSCVAGWAIGLTQMHVGDSVTMIVPYTQGYGDVDRSNSLPAYSNLIFNIKLTGVPFYQIEKE